MLARRITSGQFWWFILLAAVVLPTAASLLDFAVYRMTGDPAYAPIQLTYETIGPLAVPIERPRTDSDHDRPARGL